MQKNKRNVVLHSYISAHSVHVCKRNIVLHSYVNTLYSVQWVCRVNHSVFSYGAHAVSPTPCLASTLTWGGANIIHQNKTMLIKPLWLLKEIPKIILIWVFAYYGRQYWAKVSSECFQVPFILFFIVFKILCLLIFHFDLLLGPPWQEQEHLWSQLPWIIR